MHDDHLLIEQRLARALRRLRPAVYPDREPLRITSWTAPGEPVGAETALRAQFTPTAVGDSWGAPWGTTWFHVTGTVPPRWTGGPVEALLDIGFDARLTGFSAEALVYQPDGTVVKGLNPMTSWVRIGDAVTGGEQVDLYVEAAANPLILGGEGRDFGPTPLGDTETAGRHPRYQVVCMDLAAFDRPVWELVQDLEVLGQLAESLGLTDSRRWHILRTVDGALDRLDVRRLGETALAARAALAPAWAMPGRASAHEVSAVGHAHIDSAWLWPVRETVRKVARTVANVLDVMDRDDDLIYAMSSAQQFAWLKQHHPQLFSRVARRVAEGRFVPVGGMWVESDTNMPGGEALARQFCYGKRFFLDEFGVDTTEVWLPDSFGYTAALPQLIALSGSRWFLSQKLSWNQTNRFPHHTFWWEGIDGTRIFSHFPPVDTYNSVLSGGELAHAAHTFAEKGAASVSLVPFGHGDGGGGPTREMLARASRLADLDGSPRVRLEAPGRFFERAAADYPDAPVWLGELYLEFHRGTYTSQAATKQGNRRSEHLLREAELWSATAAIRGDADYPYDALDRIWRVVLLQQFHDILPGSSIRWVHREAVANYAAIGDELAALIGSAQAALAGEGDRSIVFNAAPHRRGAVPAGGAAALTAEQSVQVHEDGDGWVLDNGLLRVHVDRRGLFMSVRDLVADREILAPATVGNTLQLHPDTPNVFDAWDIDPSFDHTSFDFADSVNVDPVAGGVRIDRRYGNSRVRQIVRLPHGEPRVDVVTDIDWHETEMLLKAGFVIDVTAERFASEIQFGHVYRPTHRNTSWDAAKFEVCAHRWVHVGEPGYGVAIVNDSTYGHDVTRCARAGGGSATRIRLSLLRAPRSPDPSADQGHHRVRYSLVANAGIVDAIRQGYWLNLPERSRTGGVDAVVPLVAVDSDAVVVESVKLADDRSGDVVVRLYEALGARQSTVVRLQFPHDQVHAVDLLERRTGDDLPQSADGDIPVTVGPFQILTLRVARSTEMPRQAISPSIPGSTRAAN